jgi:YesN/AraC family two-component response regulator
LVLSDIRMPGMSGIRLARKVKEINPNVKVVLMTSFEKNNNEFSKVFPSTQVDGLVQKPVGIKTLTNKILYTIGRNKEEIIQTAMMRSSAESSDVGSVMKWFEEGIEDGENGIVIYPNLQMFRQICTQYVKDHLLAREEEEEHKEKRDEGNNNNDYPDNKNRRKAQSLMPRIILIATFYDTISAVKHYLSAVGVDVQSHIDDGSLLIVDAFDGYYPNTDGMKNW